MDLTIRSDHSMPDKKTRPSDEEILGIYEWAGKGTQRGGDEAAVDAEVDIIAVQGLGANPYYTWVKKAPKGLGSQEVMEVMWLRDLLPSYLRNARIATFSYLSDWYTYRKGVKTSIRELGEQLLNALHQYRRIEATGRPIIFIGQSMGGLVVKQALVLAGNRPDRNDIRVSTAGIVFLGTPHGGTDIAGYAAYIAKLKGNDPSLVESLRPIDKELFALAVDFAAGYKSLPVMCFYETVPKTCLSGVSRGIVGRFAKLTIVDQDSSVREGKDMIYLVADHSGLSKFSGHSDPNFKLVWPVVLEMAKDAPETFRMNECQEVRQMEATIVIPFARDDDFVGREDILEKLSDLFSESKHLHRVALGGLGGVGKSQIAIEYAYRWQQEHPKKWILWVHGASAARFEKSYHDIAAAAKLHGWDDPKTDVLCLVSRWLSGDDSKEWLMILDNADDESIFIAHHGQGGDEMQHTAPLLDYLPQDSRGSILVTSRNRHAASKLVGKAEAIVKVDVMDEGVSKELLKKKLPHGELNEEKCSELVEALGCLPLAITQAAAYIAVNARMTISKYLEYFQKESRQTAMLSEDGGDLRRDPEVPHAVMLTWQISFDQIKKENSEAATLLSRMCVLDRQGIPKFLFCRDGDSDAVASGYEDRDALFFKEDFDFDRAIAKLLAFSFIEQEKDGEIFQMHRLVQLSTKKWLEARGEIEKRKIDSLKLLSRKFPSVEYENWKTCETLDPHVRTVLAYTLPGSRVERAKILHESAVYAWARGKYEMVEGMILEGCVTREELLGEDHPDTLSSLRGLAMILRHRGKLEEAEKLWITLVGKCKRVLGQEHTETLRNMSALGLIYSFGGQTGKAETLEMQTLEIRKSILGQEHRDTLTSMNNLGTTYYRQRRWKEAKELYMQVLEVEKRVLGLEHPATLTSMNNLASTYCSQKRWKEAEELQLQVLEVRKRVLGQEHPVTLMSMNNLAATYWYQERWNEAEELQLQVLEVEKRVPRQEHPATLTSMNNLVSTYCGQKRGEEGEELNKQMLETRKRVLGQKHSDTLMSMNNLACIWKSQGRDKEAVDLMEQTVKLQRDILGLDHSYTVISMRHLNEWLKE